MCTMQVQMRTQEKETERDFRCSICCRVIVLRVSIGVFNKKNSIIPRARVGYEMINSQRGAPVLFHIQRALVD